jgi:hypothetical protein
MARFEVVVRPVVFPNIRPAPARSLPPENNPDQGFAEIRGNGAKSMTLTNSWNVSWSKSIQVETERTEDEARIYQMDDDETVNKDNFIDVRIARKIKARGGAQPAAGYSVGDPTGTGGGGSSDARKKNEEVITWYQKEVDRINIEIRKRDQVRKNPDEQGD